MKRLPALLLMSLLGCAVRPSPVATRPAVSQLTADGVWTWFSDPRAVYDAKTKRIYTGWITNAGAIQFASRSIATGKTTIVTLREGFERDDHNNPAFLLKPDGSLTAFYTWHRSEPDKTRGVYSRSITPDPGDTFTLGDEIEIKSSDDVRGAFQNTYSNPFTLTHDGGVARTYLFSRGANFNPVYRTNDGTTWSPSRNFMLNEPQRPYVKYASNGVDRIQFIYTDGNPGSTRNNVYYAELFNGALYKPDGTRIKNLADGPIAVGEGSLVFDKTADPKKTGDNSWVWSVARGTDDKPVVAFTTLFSREHHQYHWARWNGSKWDDHTLVPDAGGTIGAGDANYSGGMALDPLDPRIVYVSRWIGKTLELEQWRTSDNGMTWSSFPITNATTAKDVRPVVPANRPADMEMVLWLSGTYDNWDATAGEGFHTAVMLWTRPSPSPTK